MSDWFGEALAEIARQIDLGRFLIVSAGETEAGVRQSETILADAMEAVIGALYLDGGLSSPDVLSCHAGARLLKRN